jgi:hypothetical protein
MSDELSPQEQAWAESFAQLLAPVILKKMVREWEGQGKTLPIGFYKSLRSRGIFIHKDTFVESCMAGILARNKPSGLVELISPEDVNFGRFRK